MRFLRCLLFRHRWQMRRMHHQYIQCSRCGRREWLNFEDLL